MYTHTCVKRHPAVLRSRHVCNSHGSSEWNTISYCNLKPEVLTCTCFCHQSQLKEPLRSLLYFPHTHPQPCSVISSKSYCYTVIWGFLSASFCLRGCRRLKQNRITLIYLHSSLLSVCTCCCPPLGPHVHSPGLSAL